MDAVASCFSADGDDEVAGLCCARGFVGGHDADAAAVDEGVTDVAVVEVDGAVDGWDAHAVAVISDACDDLGENA